MRNNSAPVTIIVHLSKQYDVIDVMLSNHRSDNYFRNVRLHINRANTVSIP